MNEQLISFETAKLASDKGFNHLKANVYGDNMAYDTGIQEGKLIVSGNALNYILAPTQSLLQKWLRDTYKIHIDIVPNSGNEGDEPEIWYYSYTNRFDNALHDDAFNCMCDEKFNSYEEALEEALKVTLDLIDITTNDD